MKNTRIFYYAPTTNLSNNHWHLIHIMPALKKMSSEFYFYNPLASKCSDLQEMQNLLLNQVKKHKPNVFFSLTTDEYLLPETILQFKKIGIKTVNFTCDNLDRMYDIQHIAPMLDFCWVTEPEAVSMVKQLGGNPIHLPMAANPTIFKPYSCKEKYDLTFCGTKNGSRPWYISKLLQDPQLNLRIGGGGWNVLRDSALSRATSQPIETLTYLKKNILSPIGLRNIAGDLLNMMYEPKFNGHIQDALTKSLLPPLQFHQYIKLYSESKISLGFNEKGNSYHLPKPLYQLRLRDFEAPMSGACFLTHRSDEMEEYFAENKEVLFYSTFEELVDKAKFYLTPKQDAFRLNMRSSARERSLKQHTWDHRIRALFSEMKIK